MWKTVSKIFMPSVQGDFIKFMEMELQDIVVWVQDFSKSMSDLCVVYIFHELLLVALPV